MRATRYWKKSAVVPAAREILRQRAVEEKVAPPGASKQAEARGVFEKTWEAQGAEALPVEQQPLGGVVGRG